MSKFEVWEEGGKKEPEGDDESQNHWPQDGAGVGGRSVLHTYCVLGTVWALGTRSEPGSDRTTASFI